MQIFDKLNTIKSCTLAIVDTVKDERTQLAIEEKKETIRLAKENFNAAIKQIYTDNLQKRLSIVTTKPKGTRKRLSCRASA